MRTKSIHLVVQWDIHIPTCKEFTTEDPYYEYQIGTNPRLHYVDYSQIQWVENDKAVYIGHCDPNNRFCKYWLIWMYSLTPRLHNPKPQNPKKYSSNFY